MLRQDRLVDIDRYKRYREKGRISPRANSCAGSSVGTASLSTSPASFGFSSSFFSSSKSEDDEESGVTRTSVNERPYHSRGDGDLVEKTRRQLQKKAETSLQKKVERNRKLEKFEKFKRAKKTFELKKKLMEISFPSDPSITQLSQVSASKLGPTLGSNSYKDSVPKRISIVGGSPHKRNMEAKENQPIFTGSRQAAERPQSRLQITTKALTPRKDPPPRNAEMHPTLPIDPPRNIFQVTTRLLTPRKAPTPRKASLREKKSFSPVDPPRNASLIVTQALTPRNAPTPRKTPMREIQPAMSSDPPTLQTPRTLRTAPLTPKGFPPFNLPSMQEIKKQVEDRYDQIKREPPAQNRSTTSPEEKVLGGNQLESPYRMESVSLYSQIATADSSFSHDQEERGIAHFENRSDKQDQLEEASSFQSTLNIDSGTSLYPDNGDDDQDKEIINVEDIEYSLPTALVTYQPKVEGSMEHPICLEEVIDLSDVAEPPPSPKSVPKPSPLQIEDHSSSTNVDFNSFDFTFSPKMQSPRSAKALTPFIRFDFNPTNVSARPKSTSRARTEALKFSFSTPSPPSRPRDNVTSLISSSAQHKLKRSQSASRLHERHVYSGLPQSIASSENFLLKQNSHTSFMLSRTPERRTTQSSDETKQESQMVLLSPESQLRLQTSLSESHSGSYESASGTLPFLSGTSLGSSSIDYSSVEPRRQSRSIMHQQSSVRERFATRRGHRDALVNQVKQSDILIRDKRPTSPRLHGQTSLVVTTDSSGRANDEQNFQADSIHTVNSAAAQRTARMIYSQDFYRMIQKQKLRDRYLNKGRSSKKRQRCGGNGVSFVVRKRPITEAEIDIGEYDVVNAEANDAEGIIVYETKVLSDLEAKELVPHSFRCNEVISDLQTADDLYIRVARPLVDVAKGGGFATIVMCGTDDSGKNESRVAIEEHLVNDIFLSDAKSVTVQYVELCGKNCYDLLSPGSFVHIVDKEGGYFQLEGAKTETVCSSHEMLRMFSNAKRRLVSRANVRKQKDEQSFVLCQIQIHQLGASSKAGFLTLLECPVSEFDGVWVPTVDTTKAKTTEDTLMQCISAKISRRTITNPFRNINNLTKLMKESFETKESRVCVIAAISPVASETETTLTTLSSMCNVMRGSKPLHRVSNAGNLQIQNSAVMQDENLVLPRQWNNKQLMGWMKKKNFVDGSIPSNINGRVAMRLTKQQLNHNFYDGLNIGKASKLYDALRSENDRIARLRVKKRMSVSLQEYNNT